MLAGRDCYNRARFCSSTAKSAFRNRQQVNVMVWKKHDYDDIPGTYVFDGHYAHDSYALNKMLFSFCTEENRNEFDADQAAYCDKYGVTGKYKEAVLNQDFLSMLRMGGNIYYIAKMCVPRGVSVQDCGAAFQGIPTKEFQAKLLEKADGLTDKITQRGDYWNG
jgi:protocatechuate 4,5-dioxygenase alpha chain